MEKFRRYIIASVLALCCIFQIVDAIPPRPEPQRLVNDYASLFTHAQTETLERVLVAFDDSTSNQIAVVTTADLEGLDIAEYATRIGIDWQVGSEKFDNGIVIVVKPKTSDSSGKVFIAVGYGLEGAIPDAYAKRIINEVMIPYFLQNDYYGGVAAASEILMKLASGEISEMRESDDEGAWIALTVFLIIFLILIVVLLSANDGNGGSGGRRTVYVGPVITHNRNYGGFGGGSFGGGFGGGFGGFGGGSFGGGGAGGSW